MLDASVVELVRKLSPQFTIALTSNGTDSTRKRLTDASIEGLFSNLFISSEMGISKPSADFFTHVLSSLDMKAGECLLIDDNPANVAAALKMGFNTIQYTNSSDLERELFKIGISLN